MLDASLLPLRSGVLVLRQLASRDAAGYAAGTADPEVRRFARLPEPESSVADLVDGGIGGGLAREDLAVLAIARADADVFLGSVVLFDVDATSAELGFWLTAEARGDEVARVAVDLAAEFARRSGLRTLSARTVPDDEASLAVLRSSSFGLGNSHAGSVPSCADRMVVTARRELEPPITLSTERLLLRPLVHADATALQRTHGQHDVARFLLEEPWSLEDARDRVAELMGQSTLTGGARALALALEVRGGEEAPGTAIGLAQLWITDEHGPMAEVGWVLDPEHGGRGYAAEAVSAVLDYALVAHGVHRVVAQMDARNEASARLAERLGMVREAHLRQNWWSKGEWTDTLVYGLLAGDARRRPGARPDSAPGLPNP